MEFIIKENPDLEDEKVVIECRRLTDKFIRAIDILKASDHIVAYKKTRMYKIDINAIFYFELVENQIFIYTMDEVYESKQKFSEIEREMNEDFIRISRTMIVNSQKIKSIEPILNGRLEALLDNDEKLIISRQYVKVLKNRFLNN